MTSVFARRVISAYRVGRVGRNAVEQMSARVIVSAAWRCRNHPTKSEAVSPGLAVPALSPTGLIYL